MSLLTPNERRMGLPLSGVAAGWSFLRWGRAGSRGFTDARDRAIGELVRECRRREPSTRAVPLVGPVTHADDRQCRDLRVRHGQLAALDAFAEDALEEAAHRAAPRAHARELRRGQRAPLAQVYPDGVEVSGDRHDVDAHHVAQALGRRRVAHGDRLELVDGAAQRALEEAREQLLLRADVVVEAAFEQADGLGDVLDARPVIALLAEDARRRGEDLTLTGGVAAVARAAGGRRRGARAGRHGALRSRSYSAMRANTPPSPSLISFALRCATSFARRAARAKSGTRSGTRLACSPRARATWMCESVSVMRSALSMNGWISSSRGWRPPRSSDMPPLRASEVPRPRSVQTSDDRAAAKSRPPWPSNFAAASVALGPPDSRLEGRRSSERMRARTAM